MNVQTLTKNWESAKRQRNLLIAANVVTMFAFFAASSLALTRKNQTILVPTTIDQYQIQKGRIGDQYILALTRDTANLLKNRHPYDSDYFEENILRIVHPSSHEEIKAVLRVDEDNNQFRAGVRNWLPQELCVVRSKGKLRTEAKGLVEVYINGQRISEASREVIQRFEWGVEGTRVWLTDSAEIETADSECIGA